MSNIALNCKTHFSLLNGLSQCDDLAKRCNEYGYDGCVIADKKTISGAIEFHQACKKNNIKPIIGCDFGEFILIAKNKSGWFELMRIVSDIDHIMLEDIAKTNNILCMSNDLNIEKIFLDNFIQCNIKQYAIYYVDQKDVECHRILLCADQKTTLPNIKKKIRNNEEFEHMEFFTRNDFYLTIPPSDTIYQSISDKLNILCESYDITEKPRLPKFQCPNDINENDYLRQLCRIGWMDRLIKTGKILNEDKKIEYTNRIKHELDVILNANLAGYFLIVQDIVNEVKRRGWLAGPGRGSAAGCLVSFLVGITDVDPIEHGLLFERFYNEGRNTKDHISLPDIDVDVPAEYRDNIIDYIKIKYGQENVSQMITFGRLQGRAALKEVLRINDAVSFAEMNEITKRIPNEAEISDQLELMDEKSIINWALDNDAESLKNWCYKNEDGELEGPLADIFKQAIDIEGTNKSQGKHAAGVLISQQKLLDICPMVKDKNDQMIAAFEMNDLESQGHIKFDILGIDLLSKIMEIIGDENDNN
jgi:DNA polymerase-3 subunit alpha